MHAVGVRFLEAGIWRFVPPDAGPAPPAPHAGSVAVKVDAVAVLRILPPAVVVFVVCEIVISLLAPENDHYLKRFPAPVELDTADILEMSKLYWPPALCQNFRIPRYPGVG